MSESHPTEFLGKESDRRKWKQGLSSEVEGRWNFGVQLPTQQPLGAAGSAGKGRIFNSPFIEVHIWDF